MVYRKTKHCLRCFREFVPKKSNFTICPTCFKIDTKKCVHCEKRFFPSRRIPYHLKNKPDINDTCSGCWGKKLIKYTCCQRTHYDIPTDKDYKTICKFCSKCICCGKNLGHTTWQNNPKCSDCSKIKESLMNNRKLPENVIQTGYKVVVAYQVHKEDHSGYCSDPGDIEEEEFEEICEYPLVNNFKNEDLDFG